MFLLLASWVTSQQISSNKAMIISPCLNQTLEILNSSCYALTSRFTNKKFKIQSHREKINHICIFFISTLFTCKLIAFSKTQTNAEWIHTCSSHGKKLVLFCTTHGNIWWTHFTQWYAPDVDIVFWHCHSKIFIHCESSKMSDFEM